MAKSNFAACLAKTLAYEGAYSDNPKDPGNWAGGKVGKGVLKGTKQGIAASSHPTLDIKNLTAAKIASIYRVEYWTPVRGDDVQAGVDMSLFDYWVHSGPAQSVRDAQRVVGAKVDGVLGTAETLPAIRRMPPQTSSRLTAPDASAF